MKPTLALLNFSDDFALGTRSIAALVHERGYACDLIFMKRHNSAHYHLSEKNYADMIELLARLNPTVIGLSVASKTLAHAEEATRRIRKAFPKAVLVWGGWHPTMNPRRVMEAVDIDAVGVGESEETVLELMQRVEAGESLDGCKGLWTKRDGVITETKHRELIQNLDDIPYFRYNNGNSYLIDDTGTNEFHTLPDIYGKQRYGYAMVSSRGCPYNCSFCSVPFMKELYKGDTGKFLRRRSVESAIAELKYARDVLHANFVWFFDEEFLFHRRWIEQFLPEYKKQIGLPWYCQAHPDSFRDDAFVDLLADTGLRDLEIGLQSASQETLKTFNRPQRLQQQLVERSHRLAKRRVQVSYDIILDNRLETEKDVRITLDYLLQLCRPFRVQMFPLAFRENYPLTKTALAKGAITENDYEAQGFADAEKARDMNGKSPKRSEVGEFPFVSLNHLNCLIYLTQVDYFPKPLIRKLAQSSWWERNHWILAKLVMFLDRTRLNQLRWTFRRLGIPWTG